MSIQTNSLSRFNETEPIVRDGVSTFGLWIRPDVINIKDINEQDLVTIKVDQRHAGRPDVIANEQYGTSFLEWVVVMFNRPLNPLGWPQAGTIIKIPNRQVVSRLI